MELGPLLWLIVAIGGTAVLGLAYAFGIVQWRHRNHRLERVSEQVTRENYAAADRERD